MIDRETEFRNIYDKHHLKILRYLKRLVGEHEAEDLAQEVFIKVSRGLQGFRGDSQLSTWIYRIATNAALDKLRSAPFRVFIKSGMPAGQAVENEPTENPPAMNRGISLETGLILKDMNACIRSIIDRLPDDYRTVIVLSEMEELKNREIADILGITIDTVKIRLHRARAKLRKEFDNQCTFYRDERNEFVCTPKDPGQKNMNQDSMH